MTCLDAASTVVYIETMAEASNKPNDGHPTEYPLFYIRGNYYRMIHVDGIYGGGAPTVGNIVMTVFSHRIALPKSTVNNGQGQEIIERRVAENGIENELEASLVMDINTAKIMRQWLDSTISNCEAAMGGTKG